MAQDKRVLPRLEPINSRSTQTTHTTTTCSSLTLMFGVNNNNVELRNIINTMLIKCLTCSNRVSITTLRHASRDRQRHHRAIDRMFALLQSDKRVHRNYLPDRQQVQQVVLVQINLGHPRRCSRHC